jgi:AraC-like DNA-binding protein
MRPDEAPEHPHHTLSREPVPALRPFVKRLWASDGRESRSPGAREHILPTGLMHVAVRLSPEPIALWDGSERRELGHAVIGGARSGYCVKDVSAPSVAVGAQLNPGAASLLFGSPADELAERHTPLDDVWGAEAGVLRDRLGEEASLARRLDILEAVLLARLPRVRGVHPAVAEALSTIADRPIAYLVERSGYSHRAFIDLFRRSVGLPPKVFARVARFQRVADRLAHRRPASLADAALEAGYSDQAHLSREFAALAGVSPAAYRALGLREPNHVPVGARQRPRRAG